MKFTNIHRLACVFSALAFLAACSSTKEEQIARSSNNDEKIINKESSNATVTETVDVQHLLSQSNRYLDGKKSVSAAARKNFSLALAAKKAGKLDEAEAGFVELTVREPTLSGPWVQLGDIAKQRVQLSKQQKQQEQLLEKAAEQYRQAIFINSSNYRAHNRLATVYREQGQFDMALTHYQKAIDAWPAFAPAYKNRGILQDLYIGNKSEALVDYRIFQALNQAKANTDVQVAQDKQFIKSQRQIKGWIADLSRQIQQDTNKRLEVANNVL